MTTRIGINGSGRVGRALTRVAPERDDLEVVAVTARLADLAALVGRRRCEGGASWR